MDKQQQSELKRYFQKELQWGRGYQSQIVFDFLIKAATHCTGGAILDAGAGEQRYRPFFNDCLYLSQEHSIGIDFKKMGNVHYDLISPLDEKIPLIDNSINGVLSTSVIEHLKYPERFFSEACRVLLPGGRIFINVPFVYVEHEAPYDFNRPTRYGLERWLKDAGFVDIMIKPTSSSTTTVLSFLQLAVMNDLLKDKGLYESVQDALKMPFGAQKIGSFAKLGFPLSVYFIIRLLVCVINPLFDRGPHANTIFPVGWVAVGTKPGVPSERVMLKDKQAFLRSFATTDQLQDEGFTC